MAENHNDETSHSVADHSVAERRMRQDHAEDLLDLPLTDTGGDESSHDGAFEVPIDSHVIASVTERRHHTRPPQSISKWWILVALAAIGGGGTAYYLGPGAPVAESLPTQVAFDALRVSDAEASSRVELTNVGKRVLRVLELDLIGSAGDQFGILSEDCVGAQLKSGEACHIELLFRPTVMGVSSTDLIIRSNGRGELLQLKISGEGVAPRIGVDRRAFDFGLQPVAQSGKTKEIVISNLGSAPLHVQRSSITGESRRDFVRAADTCSSQTLEPGEDCLLRIKFLPQAAGLRSAELTVPSDSIEALSPILLTGRGELRGSSLTVKPGQLEFASQLENARGDAQSFRVTNRGLDPIAFKAIRLGSVGEGFRIVRETCTQKRLAPAESCSVEVSFRPSRLGELGSVVQVTNLEETEFVAVPLSGTGAGPKIVLQPSELDFGRARVDKGESFRELRVTNEGDWPATIEGVFWESTGAGDFGVREDLCSGETLAPSAECTVRLVFGPTVPGMAAAELRLEWRTEIGGTAGTSRLFGFGTAPRIEVSTSRINFGGVAATQSADRRLQISNTGTAPLRLVGVFLEESGRLAFERRGGSCENGKVLPPNSGCDISIRFVPAEPEGPRTAAIVIQSNGSPRSSRVDLVGLALPRPIPRIAVEPRSIDFDSVEVGSRSGIQTLTVDNPGSGVLRFGQNDIGGRYPEDFKLVPGSCQGADTLAPQSECTIGLRFVPLGEGVRRATLRIRHNALGDTTTIELRGEGVVRPASPPPDAFSATP
ncbi:MAG: choice-of-anchor D domain-containing protein [Thermoanaerobaculia bacterium]